MGRHRDQSGASIVIVVAIVGFLSVMVLSMLQLASSGAVVTGVDTLDRQRTYAVSSALDAAIQESRRAQWMGRYGAVCSTLTVPVGPTSVEVSCTSSTRMTDLNRTVHFEARVDGAVRGSADVVIYDVGDGAEPKVDVYRWNVRQEVAADTSDEPGS